MCWVHGAAGRVGVAWRAAVPEGDSDGNVGAGPTSSRANMTEFCNLWSRRLNSPSPQLNANEPEESPPPPI